MNVHSPVTDPYLDEPTPDVDAEVVFDALDDTTCREILTTVMRSPRSVGELADLLELPSSTAYRKVNKLVDGGLLEDHVRIRRNGHHERAYAPAFEEAVVSVGDGFSVTLSVEDVDTQTERVAVMADGGQPE